MASISLTLVAQNDTICWQNDIISHFQDLNRSDKDVSKDSLIYKTWYRSNIKLSISDNPIAFDTIYQHIKNPYFSNKNKNSDELDDNKKNYPISYSVIYNNRLISLFENGKFVCFHLDSYKRDQRLEKKLNKEYFDYHWIINGELAALLGNDLYKWNGRKWLKSEENWPLKNQPKLFEDDEFIVYSICKGEWGGTIYFFEKLTARIFSLKATCAVTVLKSSKGYHVLSSLAHMIMRSDETIIADPRKLHCDNPNKETKLLPYDKNNLSVKFNYEGILSFSSFIYQERELYIMYISSLTFIGEVINGDIEIVHPLFSNSIFAHYPVTTQYGEYTLINISHYLTARKREVSVIIIKDNKITKLDWK